MLTKYLYILLFSFWLLPGLNAELCAMHCASTKSNSCCKSQKKMDCCQEFSQASPLTLQKNINFNQAQVDYDFTAPGRYINLFNFRILNYSLSEVKLLSTNLVRPIYLIFQVFRI